MARVPGPSLVAYGWYGVQALRHPGPVAVALRARYGDVVRFGPRPFRYFMLFGAAPGSLADDLGAALEPALRFVERPPQLTGPGMPGRGRPGGHARPRTGSSIGRSPAAAPLAISAPAVLA